MSIRTSENITELSDALVKAQANFSSAIKDSTNPAFRSKYADLTSVIAAMVPHLNKEGLAIMQHPALTYSGDGDSREALVTVTTRIQHKGGQWMESELSVPAVQRDRFDAQSVGSAITYACRYSLQSIGVLGREDDDGNAATGTGSKEAAQAVAQQKIASAAKAGNKTAQRALEAQQQAAATELCYTYPHSQNGNYAEFVNIKRFLAEHQAEEDALRMVFTGHKAKKTKDETVLVPAEQMESLLNVLAGDMGLSIHKLEPMQ